MSRGLNEESDNYFEKHRQGNVHIACLSPLKLSSSSRIAERALNLFARIEDGRIASDRYDDSRR